MEAQSAEQGVHKPWVLDEQTSERKLAEEAELNLIKQNLTYSSVAIQGEENNFLFPSCHSSSHLVSIS